MPNRISNWLDTILKIVGVAGVVATIGSFIKQWYKGLDTLSLALILVALFCFIIVVVILFFKWRERTKYENLPYLIERLDNLTMEYIDKYEIVLDIEAWVALLTDFAQLLNWNIDKLLKVIPTKNESIILKEFENAYKGFSNKLIPQKKTDESLILLLDMGGILNNHNVGLETITTKPEHQKLDKRIKSLQRKVPTVKISQAVNEYYTWSEGLYCILLATKSLYGVKMFQKSVPIKIKAKQSQIRPTIERQMTNLITAVRESIIANKEKNKSETTK